MRLVYALLLLALALFLALPLPSAASGDRLYIVATLPVIADLVSMVAGERAVVESLLAPGVNVNAYEITPEDATRMAEADLFIYVGYGAEEALGLYAAAIRDGEGVVRLLDLLGREGLLKGDNPYFWMDPLTAAKAVEVIAGLLASIDPEGASYYMERAVEARAELEALDAEVREILSAVPPGERKLVTVRDTLRYFADRYGFEVVGYVTGKAGTYEPSVKTVTILADRLRDEGVRVAFIEYEEAGTTLREVLETVAEELGFETVGFIYVETLDPGAGIDSYRDLMIHNATLIAEALSTAGDGEEYKGGSTLPLPGPLKYEFMVRGLLTLIVAMSVASLVGAFAVLRGWAIFGDALAHGALAGLVVAYLAGAGFYAGALAAGVLVALIVSTVERRTRLRADVIIAVTFATMLSIAIVLLSRVGGATISIEDVLFADVTAVSREMMTRTITLSLIVAAMVAVVWRQLLLYVIEPTMAAALGVRTGLIHYTLLGLLALTVVTAFLAIGYVPTIASMMIPPAAAFLLSRRPSQFIALSVAIAVFSAVAGFYAAYLLDLNAGATAILVSAAVFALAVILKRH